MKKISTLAIAMALFLSTIANGQNTISSDQLDKFQKHSDRKMSGLQKQANKNKDTTLKVVEEGNNKLLTLFSELKNEQANGSKILELEKENAELKRKYDSAIKLAQIPKEQNHRTPYHKDGQISYDVVHLKPNEWSAPFTDRSEIFYNYLTDDTLSVDVKVTLSSGKEIIVQNLNQNKLLPQSVYDDESPSYQWRTKKEVDIVIMQCSRKAYNKELHRMAKKGYFRTPDSDFWYMNPQSPKVTKN